MYRSPGEGCPAKLDVDVCSDGQRCQRGSASHSDSRFPCGQCGFVGTSRLSLSMHITQVHRPRKLAVRSRSKCLEARLYHQLRLSGQQQRQEMLQRLSEAQRLALERWVLVHSKKACQDDASYKKRKIAKTTVHRQPVCAGPSRRRHGYVVSLCCGGYFQLFARKACDLSTAKRQQRILQEVRRAVNAKRGAMLELGQVFAETMEAKVEDLRSVGFRFAVRVPARYWVGRELRTPRYSLDRRHLGLQAFWRLQAARGAVHRANRYTIFAQHSPLEMENAWHHLREEYLEVWAEAGWSRQELLRRLQRLEAPRRLQRQSCRAVTDEA